MAQEATRAITPVGRIIWGSVFDRATQDYDGNAYEPGKGPFQFGLAVLKSDPGIGAFLGECFKVATAGYASNPNMQARIKNEWDTGFQGLNFRFKIKDGDRPNADGTTNPNGKGCWVLAMSTTLPFKCGNAQNVEIDPKTVKRGYYVDVACSLKVNEKTDATAGIYINPNVVRLLGYGEEITGGISVEDAFKGHSAPAALPPGASQTPVAPAGGIPGLPGQPGFTSLPPGQAATLPSNGPAAAGLPASVPNAGALPIPGASVPIPGASTVSRFDPVTGQPIQTAAAPQPRFDPITGQPIQTAAAQPVITGYDPQTGQPIFAAGGGLPQPNVTLTTGYPINPQTGQPVTPYPGILVPGQ